MTDPLPNRSPLFAVAGYTLHGKPTKLLDIIPECDKGRTLAVTPSTVHFSSGKDVPTVSLSIYQNGKLRGGMRVSRAGLLEALGMVSFEEREEEKRQSRLQDARDLASGKKTIEELRKENSAFELSGERIDYTKGEKF